MPNQESIDFFNRFKAYPPGLQKQVDLEQIRNKYPDINVIEFAERFGIPYDSEVWNEVVPVVPSEAFRERHPTRIREIDGQRVEVGGPEADLSIPRRFLLGATAGGVDLADILPDFPEAEDGIPGEIAEIAGAILPISKISQAAGLGIRLLPTALRKAAPITVHILRGGAAGATYGALRQAVSDEPASATGILEEAVLWAGLEVGGAAIGSLAKSFVGSLRKGKEVPDALKVALEDAGAAQKPIKDYKGFLEGQGFIAELPAEAKPAITAEIRVNKAGQRYLFQPKVSGRELRRQPEQKLLPAPKEIPTYTPKADVVPDVPVEAYWKSISIPSQVRPFQARALGIALRQTRGGKLKPSVRESGVYVPEEFATYGDFKDARSGSFGGTKDITRYSQEIDGSLSLLAKRTMEGQAGPVEKDVLWRHRDFMKMKLRWTGEQGAKIEQATRGISNADAEIANKVLEKIAPGMENMPVRRLLSDPEIAKITTDPRIVEFAQQSRILFDEWFLAQNRMRALMNRNLIPYREFYSPHELQNMSLMQQAFSQRITKDEFIAALRGRPLKPAHAKIEPKELYEQYIGTATDKPHVPDYIFPTKRVNPRELARDANLPEYLREMNLKQLLENYANTAANDIYSTAAIQNNKAFIQQLETMGFKHAARGLEDWTTEAIAGLPTRGDRWVNAPSYLRKTMGKFRKALVKTVFPLNFGWNTFVQTSSGLLTVTRAGVKNSLEGLYDWFGNRAIRDKIANEAYSFIIKAQRPGRISHQDFNTGMSRTIQLERSTFDKVTDWANFITETAERHLTGWSVAAGLRHGTKRGLKGKALMEFASDMGAKTQSMYNLEDLPGILRTEAVKTAFPFQTFNFEAMNSMKEFLGKTGLPPATQRERLAWVLRFFGGLMAVNAVGSAAIGRSPWEIYSFLPFSDATVKPIVDRLKGEPLRITGGRGLASPIGVGVDLADAVHNYLAKGNTRKIRQWSLRYIPLLTGLPAGTQLARTVDGIIASSRGGLHDSSGRLMFPITDTKEQIRAIVFGPWATEQGQEFLEKRRKGLGDIFGAKEEKEPSGRRARTRSRLPAERRARLKR